MNTDIRTALEPFFFVHDADHKRSMCTCVRRSCAGVDALFFLLLRQCLIIDVAIVYYVIEHLDGSNFCNNKALCVGSITI